MNQSKPNLPDNIQLSNSQKKALISVLNGKNVFITGSAGSGKSLLINLIKKIYKNKYPHKIIHITSLTGISAINVGGMTLHSFAGLRLGDKPANYYLKAVEKNKKIKTRWLDTDLLIIDEISMMSAELFDKLVYLAENIRYLATEDGHVFGGIQLVAFGDFFQLTPIIKQQPKDDKIFCFESDNWNRIISENIELKKIFRQTDDYYAKLLNRLRQGKHTDEDIAAIISRQISRDEINDFNIIKLFPINRLVDEENSRYLKENDNNTVFYKAQYDGDEELTEELKKQFMSSGLDTVILKKGMRVMLIKNLDVDIGLVNGSLGYIDRFCDDKPVVNFDNGLSRIIEKNEWKIDKFVKVDDFGDKSKIFTVSAKALQIPIILANSISIHKSQGQTFEKAIISLADCFADHHIYVALSRVKSLDGLYIIDFEPSKIKINKKVKKFYSQLS